MSFCLSPPPFLPFLEMEKVVCLFSPSPAIPATRRRRKEIAVYTIFLLLRFRTAKARERERNLEVLAIVFWLLTYLNKGRKREKGASYEEEQLFSPQQVYFFVAQRLFLPSLSTKHATLVSLTPSEIPVLPLYVLPIPCKHGTLYSIYR